MPTPTIYIIAGSNGVGKTTFANEFLPSIGVIRFLNADEIARGLSPLRPEAVAFKAGKLLLSELRELIDGQEHLRLNRHDVRENFRESEAERLRNQAAFSLDYRCARSNPARAPKSDRRRTRRFG